MNFQKISTLRVNSKASSVIFDTQNIGVSILHEPNLQKKCQNDFLVMANLMCTFTFEKTEIDISEMIRIDMSERTGLAGVR